MTTEEALLIKEAHNKGFGSAATIKPAHLNQNINPITVEIPADATIEVDFTGNVTFKHPKWHDNFKAVGGDAKWCGIIYYKRTEKWAEIVTTREEDLVGRYARVIVNTLSGYNKGDILKIKQKTNYGCYFFDNGRYLQLIEPGNRFETRDLELMPKGWEPYIEAQSHGTINPPVLQELSEFPSEGVCWQPTKELRDFLVKKCDQYCSNYTSRGVAWGNKSFWPVENTSGKPEYNIKQLEPFFMKSTKVTDTLETGYKSKDLVVGEYYFCIWDTSTAIIKNTGIEDDKRIKGPVIWDNGTNQTFSTGLFVENRKIRLATKGERKWLDVCIFEDKYLTPVEAFVPQYPATPDESYVPFSVRNDYRLPDKWCIKVTKENNETISKFLDDKKDEFVGYTCSWTPLANTFYFNYPQALPRTRQYSTIQEGYTEITTEQFKKHVLTHTNETNDEPFSFTVFNPNTNNLNLQENEHRGTTIKVQRPNLSIRESNPIRGIGIKCPKVKIEVRSGYLPN